MLIDDVGRNGITAKAISPQIETSMDGVKLTDVPDRVTRREVFPATFGDNFLPMLRHSNRCGWKVRQATMKLATRLLVDPDNVSRNHTLTNNARALASTGRMLNKPSSHSAITLAH